MIDTEAIRARQKAREEWIENGGAWPNQPTGADDINTLLAEVERLHRFCLTIREQFGMWPDEEGK